MGYLHHNSPEGGSTPPVTTDPLRHYAGDDTARQDTRQQQTCCGCGVTEGSFVDDPDPQYLCWRCEDAAEAEAEAVKQPQLDELRAAQIDGRVLCVKDPYESTEPVWCRIPKDAAQLGEDVHHGWTYYLK